MKTGKSAAAAWMLYLLMVIMLFLFLAPFGIVFFNSLKPLNEILLDPLSLPDQLHFENFTQAWTILNVPKALGNTVLITAVSVFFLVFLTAMSSYWISRHHDAWSGLMGKDHHRLCPDSLFHPDASPDHGTAKRRHDKYLHRRNPDLCRHRLSAGLPDNEGGCRGHTSGDG